MIAYLDHAAATPMRPAARQAWLAASEEAANPSSIHAAGQSARRLLEDARERLAAAFGCDPIEIVFTSGGTESINLALKGGWWAREEGRDVIVMPDGEHHATIDTVEWLRTRQGANVRAVRLTETGLIAPEAFAAALGPDVALATALVANNEVGTINDVASLGDRAHEAGVHLHLDAVAGWGHVPLPFSELRGDARGGVSAMSVSAHKIGGPHSLGALVVSRTARLAALHHGGAAQRDLRAGTQDVAGAVAFAVAAEETLHEMAQEEERVRSLRDALIAGVRNAVPEAELLGEPEQRLAGNAHFLFPGARGESLLYLLDQHGVAVSTGSACQAGIAEPSHVVMAIGRSEAEARTVLRLSLGRTSSRADVDAFLAAIGAAYEAASGTRR